MASASTIATVAAVGQGGQFQPGQMPPGGFQGGPPGMGDRAGGLLFGPTLPLLTTAILAVTLVVLTMAFWKLFSKTGRSGALGLLMLVPVVNLGVMLWFAFAEWPIENELSRLKALVATGPPDA